MDPLGLFGISFAVSTICAAAVAAEYLWPWLRKRARNTALKPLLLLHGFRFIGFLVPGVVAVNSLYQQTLTDTAGRTFKFRRRHLNRRRPHGVRLEVLDGPYLD